jgi:protein O-GlcNAc transferase
MSVVLAKVLHAERLLAANKVDEAVALIVPTAQKFPKDPNAVSLASIALFRQRNYARSLYFAQAACGLAPDDANYQANFGLILAANNKHAQAKSAYERALAINPVHVEASLSLANTALNESNPSAAVAYCKNVLARGWNMHVCPTLVAAMSAMGRLEEAAEFAKEALTHFPGDAVLMCGRASNLNYVWDAKPSEIAAAHKDFGRALMAQRPQETFVFKGTRDATRPIRIGVVSCDLRAHSVSFFIEPILRHAPKDAVTFYAYSTTRHEDAVSARLKPHFAVWHNCGDLIDKEVCRKIEADAIDILLDLGGLTLNNAATTCAYKPAPVIVTYCGYPNTTGVPTIDYRIVDAHTDPPSDSPAAKAARAAGEPDFDERCTEKLLRLSPCFLCYSPPADAPLPRRDREKYPAITFGSFNGNRKIIISGFLKRGVDPSRIDIHGPTVTIADHLAYYERMDLSLDTAPYNGTTTTCESLWMGVPVVAFEGPTHASRVGVSLLNVAGVPELVAPDADAYVTLAAELAQDRARLDAYRATLRDKVKNSPLCDGPAFAARFTGVMRDIFAQWCKSDNGTT